MSGYGSGPYGFAPLGVASIPTPEEDPSDLSSSRKIDGVTKKYVMNDHGGFEPMDDIDQRALLLICFAEVSSPFLTPAHMNDQAARLRAALEPLAGGKNPDIQILDIRVERTSVGVGRRSVTYRNLRKNTKTTVTA